MREISGVIEMKCEKVSGGDSRNPESGQGRKTPVDQRCPNRKPKRGRGRDICVFLYKYLFKHSLVFNTFDLLFNLLVYLDSIYSLILYPLNSLFFYFYVENKCCLCLLLFFNSILVFYNYTCF